MSTMITALLDRFLEHNAWATRRLLECSRPLTAAQLHRRFEIGPGSVHDTLVHVISAMGRWSDRIAERPLRTAADTDGRRHTVEEMLELLETNDGDLRDVAESAVAGRRLDHVLEVRFRDVPEAIGMTVGTAIAHIITHGAHHRAQVLNMLRHLGVEPLPEIDAVTCELEGGAAV